MKTIGISEATGSLSQLVDQALAGEEVLLTRQGKPVVRLSVVADNQVRATGMDWIAESRARRVGAGQVAEETVG